MTMIDYPASLPATYVVVSVTDDSLELSWEGGLHGVITSRPASDGSSTWVEQRSGHSYLPELLSRALPVLNAYLTGDVKRTLWTLKGGRVKADRPLKRAGRVVDIELWQDGS